MKRIILSVLVIICLLFSTAYAANVYTSTENGYAWIHNGNSAVGIPNASFSTNGNGNQTSVFFVESFGSASITLKQTKGECTLLSYTKLWSGITGTAQEWGKYEIECHHLDTQTYTTYSWDDTYYNEDIKIKLKHSGDYYIVVRPFSNSEMTDSYALDQFYGWTNPPVWKISSYTGCNVFATLASPTHQNITSNSNSSHSSSSNNNYNGNSNSNSSNSSNNNYNSNSSSSSNSNYNGNSSSNSNNNYNSNTNNNSNSNTVSIIGETCYIFDDGNNVRSGPGTEYEKIGQVNSGASFKIYDYKICLTGRIPRDWYKIYVNGQYGWISSGIVELHGHRDGTAYGVRVYD